MRRFLGLAVVLAACGEADDTPAQGWVADARADIVDCPGAPGCEASDATALWAGVAVRSIEPDCYESWVDHDGNFTYKQDVDTFLDCGCDRLCEGDPGYPGADEGEGDGLFRPIWIAGFQNSRPGMGLRLPEQGFLGEGDDLQARALVLDQGNTRVAIVTLDSIGWMYDDALRTRAAVFDAGLDVDHVLITSSHSHSAPDVMGIYGRSITNTGYDPVYTEHVDEMVVEAVREAVEGLTAVTVSYGQVDTNELYGNGSANLISDTRDPQIVDPRISAVRFADGDTTVASIVHWANHPETIGSRNARMSAGFVHALRHTVTNGSVWSDDSGHAGIGGTTLFIQGTVGGMMTSLRAVVTDPTGATFDEASWDKTDTVGQLAGEAALMALDDATDVADPALRVLGQQLAIPVVNRGFQAMFSLGVLDHRNVYNYDPDAFIDEYNTPDVHSEINLVQVGPIRLLSMPGEVFPENVIGGYDGLWTPLGGTLIDEGNPNPPVLADAPVGPYLCSKIGGELSLVVGLGNDEIGYVIPPYNFKLGVPEYLNEADGDHYEETNSLGPDTWPVIEAGALSLLEYADQAPTRTD